MFHADLHVHSKFSRATSPKCDLEHLAIWAAKKGIAVVGTGDFTHPAWFAEIRQNLVPAEPGLFRPNDVLRRDLAKHVDVPGADAVRFMLQVEISTIYKRNDRTRRVHHLIQAPDLDQAGAIRDRLERIGNIASDGRPILGLGSRDLLEIVLSAGDDCYLIPAHIWTPWFSVLGSKSGFDAIDDCYADLAEHIFALETGLSSNPPMNWRVSQLDRFRLVSNSDAHSPSKLARQATTFQTPRDYFAMRDALRTGRGYGGTIEFFPEQGKYHLDGHRKCDLRLSPEETRRHEGNCPECGRPVTLGVLHRVEELADRPASLPDGPPSTAGTFRGFIPLEEILSELLDVGAKSKRVQQQYETLLSQIGPELSILGDIPIEDLRQLGGSRLAEAISRMRRGEVIRQAGYDGQFGTIRLFSPAEHAKASSLVGPHAKPRRGRHLRADSPHAGPRGLGREKR